MIAPEPLAVTPVKVPMTKDVQLNVVPPGVDTGRKFSGVPLQISCISEVGALVITGSGLTVTTTSIEFPAHPLAEGVILYVTLPGLIPSADDNTWLITVPLPADSPITFMGLNVVQL